MKRISVDFNTLNSSPIGLVKLGKLGKLGTRNGDCLPELCEGERVLLWEPGLEVEALVELHSGNYWMARPDDTTWRDLPMRSEDTAEVTHS